MPKIAAIIPARDEEKTIGNVLQTIIASGYFDEVIVADSSSDNTGEIARGLGAKVIGCPTKGGKGIAMKIGLGATAAEIIVFFDADLIDLSKKHVKDLLAPVLQGKAVMAVGARSHYKNLPYIIAKADPLSAIGGERAIKRLVLENIPDRFTQDFSVEVAMNYYCRAKNLPVKIVRLNGLKLVPKEKKWGLVRGLQERIKEIFQLIKIRIILQVHKHEL